MQNRLVRIPVLCLLVMIALVAPSQPPLDPEQPAANAAGLQMTNPAAIYCAKILGYEYTIVADSDGGQRGICILPGGQKCGQWEFYAGTCGQDYNYCARQGHASQTRTDGQDPFSPTYAVCVSPEERVIGSVAQLSGLDARAAGIQASELPDTEAQTRPPAPLRRDGAPSVPSSFDWRNHNGVNWLTGIKDQAGCGSCWAFAAAGVAEAQHNIAKDNPALDLNLAEQDLVSCSSAGSCNGGSGGAALHHIRDSGIVDESCLPYTALNSSCNRCLDWQSRRTYLDHVYTFPPSRSMIRQSVVDHGPTYVSMGMGADFGGYFDGNGIYRCTDDTNNNHAVVIVGYNDSGGYWIVRNSWGASWNGDGYFRVGYGECVIDSRWAGYAYTVPPTQASNVQPHGWNGPYTNDTNPHFEWTAASDSGSGMAGYFVAVDDWTPDGGSGNDWWVGNVTAFSVPNPLPDGQHTFAVTSMDRFGSVNPTDTNQPGDAPTYTFFVDTQSPSSAVDTLAAQQERASFGVSWSGSDATSGVASYDVQYRYGASGTWTPWLSGSSGTWAVFSAALEGTYYFRSRAHDWAGNVESWPSGDGDTSTLVPMPKGLVYLPLASYGYTSQPGEPYQPVGEIVRPYNDYVSTRGVEEKGGYVYLLTRDGDLYTYDLSDLPTRSSFATYGSPVSTLSLSNGKGLLRNGDYLYAYGYGGLTVLSIQNPASPTVIGSRDDLAIYNLVQHDNHLFAPGYSGVGIYSVATPSSPALLSIYFAAGKYFFSAAVRDDFLYTSEFAMLPGDAYTYGFRVLDFSDPSRPWLVIYHDRDSVAYHLKVIGRTLIECHSSSVGMWDLGMSTNPVLLDSKFTRARACALDHYQYIVTNGDLFRLNGSTLETVATFDAGHGQNDGFPYGSAVTSEFVFIAQSPRILILKRGPSASHPSVLGGHPLDKTGSNLYLDVGGYQRDGSILGGPSILAIEP